MIRYFTAALVMTAAVAAAQTLAEEPPAAPLTAPGSDANLFIFRDHAEPMLFSPTVKIDDRKVISIGEDRFTATRIAPAPQPRGAGPDVAPAPMAPVDFSGLTGDDWDGETVVKKPAALTTSKHRDRGAVRSSTEPVGRPPPAKKPFNPDETVNLQGDIEVDIDFSDETHILHQPPPRRR